MDSVTPTATRVTKETKNKIRVDYEGKLSAGQRLKMQLTSSSFWIDKVWYLARLILMIGISFVILSPFLSKIRKDLGTSVMSVYRHVYFNITDALLKSPRNKLFTFDKLEFIGEAGDAFATFFEKEVAPKNFPAKRKKNKTY